MIDLLNADETGRIVAHILTDKFLFPVQNQKTWVEDGYPSSTHIIVLPA
jgi:hypothetical protein